MSTFRPIPDDRARHPSTSEPADLARLARWASTSERARMNATTWWDSYVSLRRAATAASAQVLGHGVLERPGLISTASQIKDAPGGNVFVHGDPGEQLRAFLRSVSPSYLEVAEGAGHARATLQDEGWRPVHDLCVMAATTASLSHDALPPQLTSGVVSMRVTDDLADLRSLVCAVEGMPARTAVQYCTELGGLDDLQLTLAHDAHGLAVASVGVRRFGDVGLVMLVQTHPDHRRRGIASALIAHAVHDARIHEAFLVATESGRGVYERIGFRLIRSLLELEPPLGRFA